MTKLIDNQVTEDNYVRYRRVPRYLAVGEGQSTAIAVDASTLI